MSVHMATRGLGCIFGFVSYPNLGVGLNVSLKIALEVRVALLLSKTYGCYIQSKIQSNDHKHILKNYSITTDRKYIITGQRGCYTDSCFCGRLLLNRKGC
jgi:hypothetical protein